MADFTITFKNRDMKKSQWKIFYRVARVSYNENIEKVRQAYLNTILYWNSEWIVSLLRTSPSAHIVTQSLLTLALRWFSEKITEWYTSVVFAEPMYDVTKIQTSLSERWRIRSLENFEQNATNSSILFGEPERNEELRHTDGSLVNYESRLKKLISECSMKNNVRGR